MDLSSLRDGLTAALLALGVAFMFLGAVGVVRMPDVYIRMQAAAKTATLGLWTVFLAVAVHSGELGVVSRALTVILLASLTVPVAAHAITRAAHRSGIPLWPGDAPDELRGAEEERPEPRS